MLDEQLTAIGRDLLLHVPRQPKSANLPLFIYATEAQDFKNIDNRLTAALDTLTDYCRQNSLNANPATIEICAFHLNNQQANYKLYQLE